VNKRKVLMVGDSLFAETLAQMLENSGTIAVVGTAPTLEDALSLLQVTATDAVIITAAVDETEAADFSRLLVMQPDLPIIRADLNADTVQVITSRQVSARSSDLLAVISQLPKQGNFPRSEPKHGA